MSFADGLLFVVAGVTFLLAVGFMGYQAVYRKDILGDYRRANAEAVRARFGPAKRAHRDGGSAPWHTRIETLEQPMDMRTGLVGLHEVIVLEDHRGERWRVDVESRMGGQTDLRAIALDPVGEAVRSAGKKAA